MGDTVGWTGFTLETVLDNYNFICSIPFTSDLTDDRIAPMKPDDKICYCFHVSLRKLVHFARREQIVRASQLSECLNAGTGCGWCIPVLKRIHTQVQDGIELDDNESITGLPDSAKSYEKDRKAYLESDNKHSF